jgi:hypothetical protein
MKELQYPHKQLKHLMYGIKVFTYCYKYKETVLLMIMYCYIYSACMKLGNSKFQYTVITNLYFNS